MSADPPAAFRARLRALDREELAAFVAALWAARGREVERRGPTVLVRRPGGDRRLLVDPAVDADSPADPDDRTGGDSASDVGRAGDVEAAGDVDRVVAPGADRTDALGDDDLWELLLYAVERDRARSLLGEFLGADLADELGASGAGPAGSGAADAGAGLAAEGGSEDSTADRADPTTTSISADDRTAPVDGADPADEPDRSDGSAPDGAPRAPGGGEASGAGSPEDSGHGGADGDRGGAAAGSGAESDGIRRRLVEAAGRTEVETGVRLVVAAALLAVTAGLVLSAAGVAPPAGDDGATETEAAPYPPGIADEGVVDADELAEAHAGALTGRSYTLALTYRQQHSRLPTLVGVEVIRVASPTNYVTTLRADRPLERSPVTADVEAFADGETRFERPYDEEYRATEASRRQRGVGRYAHRASVYVRWFLSANETRVVDRFEDGALTLYRVELTGSDWSGAENMSGTAVVDERGVVRFIRVSYRIPETDLTSVVSVRYERIGATSVEPPGWIDEARNATGRSGESTETPGTDEPTDAPGTRAPTETPGSDAPTETQGTGTPGTDDSTGTPRTDGLTGTPGTEEPTGTPAPDEPTETSDTEQPSVAERAGDLDQARPEGQE